MTVSWLYFLYMDHCFNQVQCAWLRVSNFLHFNQSLLMSMQSESAQGEAAASAMGRGRGGAAFRGRGRGMRRR